MGRRKLMSEMPLYLYQAVIVKSADVCKRNDEYSSLSF